jgi:hypothetical protein
MFQTKVVEKIKTHILCSVIFFSKNVPFMRQCKKNIVNPDRPQMTVWLMHIACWTKAAKTHSEYVILIAFPLQQWLHKHTTLLRYTFIAHLVCNKSYICSSFTTGLHVYYQQCDTALTSVIRTPMHSWWKFYFCTFWSKVFKIIEVVLCVFVHVHDYSWYV